MSDPRLDNQTIYDEIGGATGVLESVEDWDGAPSENTTVEEEDS